MANWNPSWEAHVGINHVGAYQVSGQPFTSGGIAPGEAEKVEFPYVTRWVVINNHSTTAGADVKVGYYQNGVKGTNYFTVLSGTSSPRLEVKVSEIWIADVSALCDGVEISAGLTSILPVRTSGSTGPSWSGSAGVG